MKPFIYLSIIAALINLSGCELPETTEKVVSVVEYTTIGLGPEGYRKGVIENLAAAGIPVEEGEPRENGIADVSWPKKYDELAYSIYRSPVKLNLPSGGGFLNVGKCESTGRFLQLWQTDTAIHLISVEVGVVKGQELNNSTVEATLANISQLAEAKKYCADLIQEFGVLIPDPSDKVETSSRLVKLGVDGKIERAEDGYYYWSK